MSWGTVAATLIAAFVGFTFKMLADVITERSQRDREDRTRFVEARVQAATEFAGAVATVRHLAGLKRDLADRIRSTADQLENSPSEAASAMWREAGDVEITRIRDADHRLGEQMGEVIVKLQALQLVCADKEVQKRSADLLRFTASLASGSEEASKAMKTSDPMLPFLRAVRATLPGADSPAKSHWWSTNQTK